MQVGVPDETKYINEQAGNLKRYVYDLLAATQKRSDYQ
jgi:hypothetical protein